jgi:putative oxidoreductase
MKIAAIIIRVLMGLLFLFSSIAFFFNLIPTPELTGSLKTFNDGITASGYLMQLIKGTELVCAIAFIVGRFVPLAVVVIFPVIVNIVLVHALLAPEGLPVAIFLLLADLFLAYYYRERYKTLVAA